MSSEASTATTSNAGSSTEVASAGSDSAADSSAAETANGEVAEGSETGEDTAEAEGSEAGSEELTAGEKKELDNLKRKLKLKVDGQEIEEDVDLSDDEYLIKNLQKSKAFDKKAQETATIKKQFQGLLDGLTKDTVSVLRELGIDVDELAYNHLDSKVKELSKSPEQIAQEKMQKEYEQLKAEKERLQQDKDKAEQEKMLNEEASRVENEIISALDKHNGLLSSDDPTALADISRAMLRAMSKGMVDVKVEDVLPIVERQYAEKLQKRLGTLSKKDAALVEKLLGKDLFEDARKRRLTKKKKSQIEASKQTIQDTGTSSEPKGEKENDKTSYKNFFKPY